ncbi:MAG TPA: CHASE3 domain-containing protein [Planctomycetaceae bacterium]|nr:CHASE3 domain-containing protein [Planctomycetaceae bacterium]
MVQDYDEPESRRRFVIALLPLLAIGWFSFQTPRQYVRLSDSSRQNQQVIERLATFLSDMKDLETGQRGYLLTANDRYLKPFLAAKGVVELQLDELRRLAAGNAVTEERLTKLDVLVHRKIAELERTIDLRRNDSKHGFDEALKIVQTDADKQIMDEIREIMTHIQRDEERRRDQSLKEAETASRWLVGVASIFSPLAVVLMALSVWLILRDLAARARAEAEVRRQRAVLETVLASMGEGVAVADAQGRFQLFNPMARQLLGAGLDNVAPRDWSSRFALFLPDAVTSFPAEDLPLVRALRGETCDNVEMRAGDADVTDPRFLNATGRPISDDVGRFHGGVVVFHDITEQKRAQAALTAQAEMLKRSNRELEQFAYVASHDLKEPLRMVASYTTLLSEEFAGKLGTEGDKYINYAVDGARRMQALIDDLLNFSRVGRTGGRIQPVDLEKMAEIAVSNLEGSVLANSAVVAIGKLPIVRGNPTLLSQLIQNLIANAIKFHGDTPPVVGVSARRQDDEWVICVEDNGIGIAPEYRERVFELFQRLHGRGKYEGTGIGLSICRKVVEQHGGRIWVESQLGRGSRFYFTLPAEGRHNLKRERQCSYE